MTPFITARRSVRRLPPPAPRWRNERLDKRPLLIRQVARIAQMITIVFRSVSHPSTSAAFPRNQDRLS